MDSTMWVLAAAGAGFLSGSVPYGYLIVRWLRGEDIRRRGSGNIGATNVGRGLGVGGWAATVLLDAGKGALPVWLAWRFRPENPEVAAAAGFAAILGHCFTPWLGWRGGKGVATMLGVFALLAPVALLVAVACFAVVAGVTRYASAGSLAAAVALAVATRLVGGPPPVFVAALLTLLVVIQRHRDNIRRLLAGTETKMGRAR